MTTTQHNTAATANNDPNHCERCGCNRSKAMSVDISTLSVDELIRDREESEIDIGICRAALAIGITHHHDGMLVQYRLDTNRKNC